MASTEVIKKEVPSNSEVKDSPDIISREIVNDQKSIEKTPNASTNDAQQQQQTQSTPQVQPQPQNQQLAVRTRSSREEKIRKKDDKSVDHVLKALNCLNTTEEKLAAMCKKYADIFDENRKVQLTLKQVDKQCITLQREKLQLQADHSKAILTRSRLENLCRELQRQNKAIKDESLLKIREEEEKRKEVSAKFQTTLNEITTLMQQNNDKNMKLRDDNIDMNAKLKNVCEQYELREQQVEKISKQMQLEAQLADAKLAKAKMEMAAEREIMLREKQQLLLELQQYQARCQEFQATEINLRNQISTYDDKYDEFQKALTRSNEVFGGFKGEMEKMSKKVCKLEKEVSTWKQRWEGSHRALLEMAEEKQKADVELSCANRQVGTLQRLCRTLQTERSNLLAKLRETTTSDGKTDVPDSKIQNVIENVNIEQINKNVENSSNQLLNGDAKEISNPNKDNLTGKNLASLGEISSVEQTGFNELASSIKEIIPNESVNSKETPISSDKSSSEILVDSSEQLKPLSNDVSSSCKKASEKDDLKGANSCSLNSCSISALNNDSTSPKNVIINNTAKLPRTIKEPVSSGATLNTDVTSPEITESSNSSTSITKSVDMTVSIPAVNENSNVTAKSSALVEQSVTTLSMPPDISISNGNIKLEDNNKDNLISAGDNSSVEYTVADVLKTTKVTSSASSDASNKRHSEGDGLDNSTKEAASVNRSIDSKLQSNEQPSAKKLSHEPKKGKESRKKKKAA